MSVKPNGPVTEGVPLASIIPRKLTEDPELVMAHRPKDAVAERYRPLRSKIEITRDEKGSAAMGILVTSSVPDEGETTTALNLALESAIAGAPKEEQDRRLTELVHLRWTSQDAE